MKREFLDYVEDAVKAMSDAQSFVKNVDYEAFYLKHLRTTNVVESLFAALRLRTNAAKRYKKMAKATAVTCKIILIAERRFRKLDARDKLNQVYLEIELERTEAKQEEALVVA